MTRGGILIRAREPEDLEAIAEISACPSVVAGTLQLPFRSLAERRARMVQPEEGVHHLVAEVEGRVVGTLGLHVETTPRRRHCGSLGMAVHDRFQGQGVGTALLAAAIDLADKWLGLRRLELHVYADNAAGIRLYESSALWLRAQRETSRCGMGSSSMRWRWLGSEPIPAEILPLTTGETQR